MVPPFFGRTGSPPTNSPFRQCPSRPPKPSFPGSSRESSVIRALHFIFSKNDLSLHLSNGYPRMKRLICILLLLCWALSFHAQSRLFPSSEYRSDSSFAQMLLNGNKYNDFAFAVRPSFDKNSGCWYDANDSVLVLREALPPSLAPKIVGSSKNKYSQKLKVMEFRCKITPSVAESIRQLFLAAVYSSSYLAAKYAGCDGTTYQLFVKGGLFSASCWSPTDNSNCGMLVNILGLVSEAIRNNNPQVINALIPDIEALTLRFEALYPDDVKDPVFFLPDEPSVEDSAEKPRKSA